MSFVTISLFYVTVTAHPVFGKNLVFTYTKSKNISSGTFLGIAVSRIQIEWQMSGSLNRQSDVLSEWRKLTLWSEGTLHISESLHHFCLLFVLGLLGFWKWSVFVYQKTRWAELNDFYRLFNCFLDQDDWKMNMPRYESVYSYQDHFE